MFPQKPTKINLARLLIAVCLLAISFLAGKYYEKNIQTKLIGDTNTQLLALLTKPSDFNSSIFSLKKSNYQFTNLLFDIQEIGKANSTISGKQTSTNSSFVLIHEIIVYEYGKVPSRNASDYYAPPAGSHKVEFPGIEKNDQTYCWSSKLDNLSEGVVTIRNLKIISTFDKRIFNPDEQLAFELLPAVVSKFTDRLVNSEFGK